MLSRMIAEKEVQAERAAVAKKRCDRTRVSGLSIQEKKDPKRATPTDTNIVFLLKSNHSVFPANDVAGSAAGLASPVSGCWFCVSDSNLEPRTRDPELSVGVGAVGSILLSSI